MKMSELSAATGLAIPTIKYYLREGLVPPGVRTARNQADYGHDHVHRLRLIRALVEVGELPISTVAAIVAAVDDETRSTHDVLGVVHHALALRGAHGDEPTEVDDAVPEIEALLADLGWRVSPRAPAVRELARVLVTLRRLGWEVGTEVFRRYARAADQLAAWELKQTGRSGRRAETVEGAVVGTVLFEAALAALRRLAEEHHSAARFGAPEPTSARQQEPTG